MKTDEWSGVEAGLRDEPPEALDMSTRAGLNAEQIATLTKALAIGWVSWEGDGWYAKDAGYDYDDAEDTLRRASRILAAL